MASWPWTRSQTAQCHNSTHHCQLSTCGRARPVVQAQQNNITQLVSQVSPIYPGYIFFSFPFSFSINETFLSCFKNKFFFK